MVILNQRFPLYLYNLLPTSQPPTAEQGREHFATLQEHQGDMCSEKGGDSEVIHTTQLQPSRDTIPSRLEGGYCKTTDGVGICSA